MYSTSCVPMLQRRIFKTHNRPATPYLCKATHSSRIPRNRTQYQLMHKRQNNERFWLNEFFNLYNIFSVLSRFFKEVL